MDIKVLMCHGANREFVRNLSLVAHMYKVPCTEDMNYPMADIEEMYRYLGRTNIVWISDEIYSMASQIKETKFVIHLLYLIVLTISVALHVLLGA